MRWPIPEIANGTAHACGVWFSNIGGGHPAPFAPVTIGRCSLQIANQTRRSRALPGTPRERDRLSRLPADALDDSMTESRKTSTRRAVGLCRRATVVGGQLSAPKTRAIAACGEAVPSSIRRTFRHPRRRVASYPRRQQIRRLRRAGVRGLQAVVALTGVLLLAWADQRGLASAAVLIAAALAFDGALTLRRARRSRIGAESEALVRRALEPLKRHGWRVRHSLDWPGPGDLDHVVRAPTGIRLRDRDQDAPLQRAGSMHCAQSRQRGGWRASAVATRGSQARPVRRRAAGASSTWTTGCWSCRSTAWYGS